MQEFQTKSIDELCPWGGKLDSTLALQLNYPPEKKLNERHGRSPDLSVSPCIRKLQKSGFHTSNVIWLDTFCRQEKIRLDGDGKKEATRCKPWAQYPASVRDCHLAFVEDAYRCTGTKVIVLFGKDNQEGYKSRWTDRLDQIRLWGDQFAGVKRWVVYTTPERTAIEHLVLPAMHPEGLSRSRSLDRPIEADRTYLTASTMCCIVRSEKAIAMQQHLTSEQEHRRVQDLRTDEEKAAVAERARQARAKGKVASNTSIMVRNSVPGTEPVETHCRKCGSTRVDHSPRYWDKDPQFYVTRDLKCDNCTEMLDDAAPGKSATRTFIPVNRLVPWILAMEAEFARTPLTRMLGTNITRQTQQADGISLEGPPILFTVPPGSGDDYDGPVTITGLSDNAGDPNIAKSKCPKNDKRMTRNGRHGVHRQMAFAPAAAPIPAAAPAATTTTAAAVPVVPHRLKSAETIQAEQSAAYLALGNPAAQPVMPAPAPVPVLAPASDKGNWGIKRRVPADANPPKSTKSTRAKKTKVEDPGQSKISSFFGKPQDE
ncbi:hypothetical protein MCOR27_007507 [Pyricularia oryzae]|uniref:Heterokaryon incompatibility domain-containing protein n=1 Tax=Pyricularia grisea TaxID=148305 RepID=A0ABQ8NYN4_PYRGI|nr:hypothetical protein MCOR02_002807 [Pyricularia oryzae]KAI6304009.1 hypothetical protein MCOR33_000989 [Pyricularia grisea]KAI6274182.1 hypothetical protein MCOR27_007507 [Pyricularia oryzae]KAI6276829.1 hypothetical protein MCOR26_005454 [Pyricularia oryzae]KAI6310354.1 hypothetical protein MCOR34_006403 [Pyricularia oryzae]